MSQLRFYEHFACAYGTFWLLLLSWAMLTSRHVDAGAFGMFGFPMLSLVYAFVRRSMQDSPPSDMAKLQDEVLQLRKAAQDSGRRAA